MFRSVLLYLLVVLFVFATKRKTHSPANKYVYKQTLLHEKKTKQNRTKKNATLSSIDNLNRIWNDWMNKWMRIRFMRATRSRREAGEMRRERKRESSNNKRSNQLQKRIVGEKIHTLFVWSNVGFAVAQAEPKIENLTHSHSQQAQNSKQHEWKRQ